jgi:hypothetical protein
MSLAASTPPMMFGTSANDKPPFAAADRLAAAAQQNVTRQIVTTMARG